jgi:lactoylglutathione lyase
MKLNHLNLAVSDVSEARGFFQKYFGFQCIHESGRNIIAVLRGEGGFVLNLGNFDTATEVKYPRAFHVGFIQDSRERVNEINQLLTDGGFDVESPREFHGNWTFHLRAAGGFLLAALC